MSTRGRFAGLAAALTMAAMSLVACGSSDSGGSGGGNNSLRIWHYEGPDSAMGVAWAQAVEEFKKAHPGVSVIVEEKGFEQVQKTAPMALNSKDAPDVMEYNKGNATAGLLAKQGLLTDISAEATKRGWDKLLSPSVQTTCRYDAKGVMGSGNWYGIPNYSEFLQVFYNKDMFAKYGVSVPTTMAELTAAMDTFIAAGVTPFASAGAEYMAQQYLYQFALSKADRSWVDAYERYTGKADFHDAAWTYAANTFSEWVNKGYFAKNSVSTKAEDAGVAFMGGKFPMLFSGSWWAGRFEKQITAFKFGAFLWPETKLTLGSGGNLWVVPKNSPNKDLAYEFIDLTMKKNIQNLLGNSGGVPVAADAAAITSAKAKELIQNYQTLVSNDGLAFYPDWPVPGFYDVLVSNVQKLINGSASPSQVLDALQKAYDKGKPAG
jgi:raffinose/stachyose/melibiose transport system substrate-binding protein